MLGAAAVAALAAGVAGAEHASPALAQAAQTQASPVQPQASQPIQPRAFSAQLPSFSDLVDRVKPAVVSVRVKIADDATAANSGAPGAFPDLDLPDGHPLQEFLKRFRQGEAQRPLGQGRAPVRMSQGSGFFISADGYLVTNNHVIDKNSEVEVLMDDGRTLPAKVIGADPKTDLALLKVEGRDFPHVALAGQSPRVGDWVIAVGNPFGLGGTVTAGIVSARGRDIGAGPYDDFLQIDAPINRGNSGGPTFNQAGEVVGVNTAITSPSGGNVGIAFAIPSETVRSIVRQLQEKGTVERGFLGVRIQPVTKDIAASIGLDEPRGAIIAGVEEGGPAAKAGLKPGDVVLALNGQSLKDARALSRQVASLDPDTSATLQVWRGEAKRDIAVTLGRQAGERRAAASTAEAAEVGRLGLSLAPAASIGGLDRKGVAVVKVEPGSKAESVGLKTGDVIAEVAGRPVETPADVRQALAQSRKDGKKAVLFRVEAKEGARFVAVQLPTA